MKHQIRQFKKKPVVIEAIQFDGTNHVAVAAFTQGLAVGALTMAEIDTMTIPTLERDMQASKMDWIIKGVGGEFYPCKPDIFAMTYDPVRPEEALHDA